MSFVTRVEKRQSEKRIESDTNTLFKNRYLAECKRVNKFMMWLMAAQWVAGILFALFYSPLTWIGQSYEIHVHVWAAVLLGGAISGFAVIWTRLYPNAAHTRHVIAVSQILWSALLIHLTGGRIETHFHVFASLAILSIYRDWKILITATVVVALDHFVRGVYYPLSAFGVVTESPYRWMEHAAWVIFEVAFLVPGCMRLRNEIRELCVRQTELEVAKKSVDVKVDERTREVVSANVLLAQKTREAEKLALVARHTDNAVAICDHDSKIEWINEGYTRITGYTLDEVIGKSPCELQLGPRTDLETIKQMRNALQTQSGFGAEVINYNKSGNANWLAIEVQPIPEADKKASRFIVIQRDIGNRKSMELALAATEQRTRSLMNNVPGAFYRRRAFGDREMLFMSKAITDISGYSPADFTEGLLITSEKLVHPLHVKQVEDAFEIAISTRKAFELEYRINARDGQVKWVLERGQCLVDDENNVVIDGMVFDITQRKIADAELVSKGKVIEDSLNEIFIFDANSLKFLYANRGGRANLGYGMEELVELTPIDIKPNFTCESFTQSILPLKTGAKQQLVFQTPHQRKDGSTYIAEVRLQNTQFQEKECFLAMILDVTEQVETAARNGQLQDELVDASRKAGMADVATGVLHNVGNILNSVNISASIIRRSFHKSAFAKLQKVTNLVREKQDSIADFILHDNRGKKLPEFIVQVTEALADERSLIQGEFDDLLKNIEHIKEIVSAQQSTAKASGAIQNLSAKDLINDLMVATKNNLSGHHISISQNIEEPYPLLVSDKHKILQILINLVGNAKDSLVESRVEDPAISIDVVSNRTHVVIKVEDNGVGISQDMLARIFQQGFTTKQTGHGFGLHSCANAATELGGALSVTSDGLGLGAMFELTLPKTKSVIISADIETYCQMENLIF